jgi:hypothetical protein
MLRFAQHDMGGRDDLTTVLWARNAELYRQLAQQHPETVARTVRFTADASLCWLWGEENAPYNSLWSFVTLDEQVDVAQQAQDLADAWLGCAEVLRHQDVYLGELCQTDLLYTFRDALLARRMVARFFQSTSPRCLLLPTSGGTTDDGMGVLAAVLRWEAERQGIGIEDVTVTPVQSAPGGQRIAERLRRNLGAVLSNAIVQRRQRRPHRGPEAIPATVMFFGSGTDFVNQLHLTTQLRATRPYRVIHVSLDPVRASAYSRSQVVERQPALHLLPYRSPQQYLALHALGQRAWQWFQHKRVAFQDSYPELFCNEGLDPSFQSFFLRTISRAGGILGTAGCLLDAYRPALIVLNNDAGGRQRAIVQAARQRGIPSAQMIHSGFNDLHFRRGSTDQVWVWGEVHRRQLTSLGIPDHRILITGNPNYDYLVDVRREISRIRLEVREELGLAADDLVLVMATAKVPHMLTFVDMEQHALDLKAVCQELAEHPGVRLVIKPHPRYDDLAIYRLLAQRYAWISIVDQIMLDRLLPACDAALMVNAASTAAIEALLLNRPVIWVRPSTRYPPSFDLFEPGVWTIDHHSQIGPVLRRLVNSRGFRQSVADQGQEWLPALVTHRDGSATEAVLAAVDGLVRERGRKA